MVGGADWFVPFFRSEAYLGFHDAYVSGVATKEEVDFIEHAMGLAAPQELLDVPCGEGRVAIELTRRGHRVTGTDLSEPLRRHRDQPEHLPGAIPGRHQD